MDETQAKRETRFLFSPAVMDMIAKWNAEIGSVVGRDPLVSAPYKKGPLPSKGVARGY